MKIAVVVLLTIVAVFAWLLNAQVTTNKQQTIQIAELTSKLSDKTARENLELQQKCAVQAEKTFRFFHSNSSDFDTAEYESHFNAKLNRCFVSIETFITPQLNIVTKKLFDAYEQRLYAEYAWTSSKVKKYWEQPPLICRLIPTVKDERICTSEEEYKKFVATYME